jgi:alpha-glucosidase (family GH31 glycosyl hydrolase)
MSIVYGSHPFYLQLQNNKFHGVFLLNSNAQEFVTTENTLTYRTIGGIMDIYIFLGPTAEEVIQQYHEVIGKPFMPPFWGLGWHQCRLGYHNLTAVQTVVEKYKLHGTQQRFYMGPNTISSTTS